MAGTARTSGAGHYIELTGEAALSSAAGWYIEIAAAQARSSAAGWYIEIKNANAYSSGVGWYVEHMSYEEGPTRRSFLIFNGHVLSVTGWSFEATTRQFKATNLQSDAEEAGAIISDWTISCNGHWSRELDDILGSKVAQNQDADNSIMLIIGHRNREVVYSSQRSFVTKYRQNNGIDDAMLFEASFAISGKMGRASL